MNRSVKQLSFLVKITWTFKKKIVKDKYNWSRREKRTAPWSQVYNPKIIITKRAYWFRFYYLSELKIHYFQGFPGGAVVENLPANAGDTGSSPGLGWSHMPRSNWAREPRLLSLRVWSLCSATREAAIVRGPRTAMKSGHRLPQLEEALAQKRRPNTAKNK